MWASQMAELLSLKCKVGPAILQTNLILSACIYNLHDDRPVQLEFKNTPVIGSERSGSGHEY